MDHSTHATRAHLICHWLCQTTMDSVGIMTTIWQGNNFDRRQVSNQRKFSHSPHNNTNFLTVLEVYSTKRHYPDVTKLHAREWRKQQGCNNPVVGPHWDGSREDRHRSPWEFHNAMGHQGISWIVNMVRQYFWWVGMWRDVHQHISTCRLCIQFLPNKMYTQPLHLEIPNVPFACCTMDCIWPLPATSKGHRHVLTFICLLTSYLTTVPLKSKTVDEVSMAYMKEIIPKTSYLKFVLQHNGTEFRNEQLMSMFDNLGIKGIYSNPYYPKGNSRMENVHSFLKHTIAKFMYDSQLEWNDALPLAIHCYNIAPSADDLESPFYLVHGRDPLEGRLSNLQNYCRYVVDQPGWVAMQELRKLWKLHARLFMENRVTNPKDDRKVTRASYLKIGNLVFVENHQKGTFDPTFTFDHSVSSIVNESTVTLTTPDGKEKRCNIHHIKPLSALESSTRAFQQLQDSIQKDSGSTQPGHQYNLCARTNKL